MSRFSSGTASRDAPPIGVSSALVLSFAAFSIGGVWAIALDVAPSIPLMICPAILLQPGFVESSSHFRLASHGCCSDGALVALLRLVVPYTLALSMGCSAGSSSGGSSRTSAPLLALSTGPMMFLLPHR